MALFFYKAIDFNNKRIRGKIEKQTEDEVRVFLKSLGYVIIDIKKLNYLTMDISDFEIFKRVNLKEIAVFCRQLSFILGAGVDISRTFQILARQTKSKAFKNTLIQICDMLMKGETLSDCFSSNKTFPILLIGMTKIGESSGQLPLIMGRMANYYENRQKSKEELIGAMIYPVLVTVLMLSVIVMAIVMIIPTYAGMFYQNDAELPIATKILLGISNFFIANMTYLSVAIFFIIIAMLAGIRTEKGKRTLDWLKLNVVGVCVIYRKLINLQFAEGLSLMLNSGQQLVDSMYAVRNIIDNKIIYDIIGDIIERMKEGQSLGTQLEQVDYFESVLSNMVAIGEETADLPSTIAKCAEYFQNETNSLIARLNKVIEPVIIFILGLMLTFIMLSVLLPVFTMVDYI